MDVEERRRRRRRLRRQAAVLLFLMLSFALAWFFEAQATTTIIIVRYAERQLREGENSGLSAAGHARAAELARVLGDADVVAGVDAIFASRYRYTQETAQPIAQQLGLPVGIVDFTDVKGLLKGILPEHKGEVILIVTHREPIPVLIRRLQGSKKVPPIAETEHDNLYIVSIPWYGKVKTLRLKYGAPYVPESAPAAAPMPAPAAR